MHDEFCFHGPVSSPGQAFRFRSADPRSGHLGGIWWLTSASLLFYWILYGLAWPTHGLDKVLRARLPWAFPLLAMELAFWSQAPVDSMRTALLLMLVTGCGLLSSWGRSFAGRAARTARLLRRADHARREDALHQRPLSDYAII